jgi:superoxide dismutase
MIINMTVLSEIFDTDVFYEHIVDHLAINDLHKLQIAMNKKIMSLHEIKHLIITRLTDKLKKSFGSNYDEFIKIFKNCDAMISGSSILQCAYNEDWRSGIDIFVTDSKDQHDKDQFNNFMDSHDYAMYLEPNHDKLYFNVNKINISNNTIFEVDNTKIKIISINKKDHKYVFGSDSDNVEVVADSMIAIIPKQIEEKKLLDVVLSSFDLTICMNAFWIDQDGVGHLHINCMNEIINRTSEINESNNNPEVFERWNKYNLERKIEYGGDPEKLLEIIIESETMYENREDEREEGFGG